MRLLGRMGTMGLKLRFSEISSLQIFAEKFVANVVRYFPFVECLLKFFLVENYPRRWPDDRSGFAKDSKKQRAPFDSHLFFPSHNDCAMDRPEKCNAIFVHGDVDKENGKSCYDENEYHSEKHNAGPEPCRARGRFKKTNRCPRTDRPYGHTKQQSLLVQSNFQSVPTQKEIYRLESRDAQLF